MTDIPSPFDGRRALVTGSTRGIGRAIAEALVIRGAAVAVHGRSSDRAAAAAAEMGAKVGVGRSFDSAADADAAVAAAVDSLGGLDLVVNNAGVALDNFITGVTDERWDASLATNLTAPFAVMRAAARVFKDQGTGGAIVNITSTSGERGNAGQAAYSAAKAGLHGLTQTAARELGRFGVRVNSVSPLAGTDMNGLSDPERAAAIGERLPLGAVAATSEVAEVVLFLLSDSAGSITGDLLHADAGYHLI